MEIKNHTYSNDRSKGRTFTQEQNRFHTQITNMRPLDRTDSPINSKLPRTRIKQDAPGKSLWRQLSIEKENIRLVNRMEQIRNRPDVFTSNDSFKYPRGRHSTGKTREQKKIDEENNRLYLRLANAKPQINVTKMMKDYNNSKVNNHYLKEYQGTQLSSAKLKPINRLYTPMSNSSYQPKVQKKDSFLPPINDSKRYHLEMSSDDQLPNILLLYSEAITVGKELNLNTYLWEKPLLLDSKNNIYGSDSLIFQFRYQSGKVLLLTLRTSHILLLCNDNKFLEISLEGIKLLKEPNIYSTFYHTLCSQSDNTIMNELAHHILRKCDITLKEVKLQEQYVNAIRTNQLMNKQYEPYQEVLNQDDTKVGTSDSLTNFSTEFGTSQNTSSINCIQSTHLPNRLSTSNNIPKTSKDKSQSPIRFVDPSQIDTGEVSHDPPIDYQINDPSKINQDIDKSDINDPQYVSNTPNNQTNLYKSNINDINDNLHQSQTNQLSNDITKSFEPIVNHTPHDTTLQSHPTNTDDVLDDLNNSNLSKSLPLTPTLSNSQKISTHSSSSPLKSQKSEIIPSNEKLPFEDDWDDCAIDPLELELS